MKLYLGNKMTGTPYFNAPWFDAATEELLGIPNVDEVFNPAQHDRDMGFDPMLCPKGSSEEAKAAGFSARDALSADWTWIAYNSDGLIVGPQWESSPGTISEIACHQALKLPVWEFATFMGWHSPLRHLRSFKLADLALRPLLSLGKLDLAAESDLFA